MSGLTWSESRDFLWSWKKKLMALRVVWILMCWLLEMMHDGVQHEMKNMACLREKHGGESE